MSGTPLMPKATAVWLVDNTTLTFEQIAHYCGLHKLEVQGIADGDVASGIKGQSPITTGQLARDEIEKAEADPEYRLTSKKSTINIPMKKRRGPRYTPVSKRQDRPNAILWLVRHHPELKDRQIIKLVGTTKPTIEAIRERSHWNSANLTPMDPVILGLCTQIDLDMEVKKSAPASSDDVPETSGVTLLSAAETEAMNAEKVSFEQLSQMTNLDSQPDKTEELDADAVFANLGGSKTDATENKD